jgi:hypothetical protein
MFALVCMLEYLNFQLLYTYLYKMKSKSRFFVKTVDLIAPTIRISNSILSNIQAVSLKKLQLNLQSLIGLSYSGMQIFEHLCKSVNQELSFIPSPFEFEIGK